jgi:diazepam-binding inhibitor (GABA receptor modulating acyl-CoA-binding protein)
MEYTVEEVEEVFDEAVTLIGSTKLDLPNEQLLALYGFYKQATTGKCNIPQPSFFDFKGKAKWYVGMKVNK